MSLHSVQPNKERPLPEDMQRDPEAILADWRAVTTAIESDPYVAHLAEQTVVIPGVVTGEALVNALQEVSTQVRQAQEYFESECAAIGIELTEAQRVNVDEMFERSEACHVATIFLRNGLVTSEELTTFTDWIEQHRSSQENCMCALAKDFYATDCDYKPLADMLMYMTDDLCVPFEHSGVSFLPSPACPPSSGDIIPGHQISYCLISEPVVAQDDRGNLLLTGSFVAYDAGKNASEVLDSACLTVPPDQVVSRGGNRWLISPEEPLSRHSPYRVGVRLEREVEDSYNEGTFEKQVGQIIAMDSKAVTVLWSKCAVEHMSRDSQGFIAAELYSEPDNYSFVASLKVDGTERIQTRRNPIVGVITEGALQSPAKEHPPIDIRALCAAVQWAEFPLLVQRWGMDPHFGGLNESISQRTVSAVEKGAITRDADTLLKHGAKPVLLVAESDDSAQFKVKLTAMASLGWQVILWDNPRNKIDVIFQTAIRSLPNEDSHSIRIVSGTDRDVLSEIEKLGEAAAAEFTTPVVRSQYSRPALRRSRSYTTQRLLEISDAQLEHTPSVRVRMSAELLSLCREAAQAGPREQGAILEQAFSLEKNLDYSSVRGRTRLETELSGYDFVDIAAALARSRLPANHPAVSMRGVTCGDLSPKALEEEYRKGANFYTVRAPDGTIDGVAITYPPAVLELERPGLSEKLGAPGKTGYLYWLWVNPDEESYSTRVYPKLVTAFLLEQVVSGADSASAVILERNIPSLKAAVAVAGFQVLPWTVEISGERAVRVGFNLKELDAPPRQTLKEATALTTEVFSGERSSDIASGARRYREALEHIEALIEVRESWQQVHEVVAATNRYEPFVLSVERVENAVQALGDTIHWRIRQESILCLAEVTHEATRDAAMERFDNLLREFAPESLKHLQRLERQMVADAPEFASELVPNDKSVVERFHFDKADFPHEPVRLALPEVDLEEMVALRGQFSETYRSTVTRLADSMLIRPEELHVERESDRFEQYRWKRMFLREVYSERGRVFPDLASYPGSATETEIDRRHASAMQAYFAYGNAHIAADTYDQAVAKTIMPGIRAFLYGQTPE